MHDFFFSFKLLKERKFLQELLDLALRRQAGALHQFCRPKVTSVLTKNQTTFTSGHRETLQMITRF